MPSLINNALSGLLSAQRSLTTTSNNIANVGTEGYSRQRPVQVQGPITDFGRLQQGSGSQIIGVERIYDQLLGDQLTTARSGESKATLVNQYALRLEGLLGDPQLGITGSLQRFFDQVSAVANDPTSTVSRQQLLAEGQSLAQRFQQLNTQIDGLESELNQRLSTAAIAVNDDLQAIAAINGELVANQNSPSNSLLDQRQLLIDRVASQLDVLRTDQPDGSVTLLTSNGQPLVLGTKAFELGVQRDVLNAQRLQLTVSDGVNTSVISRQVTGGEIGGLLSFRTDMLDPARRELGRIAVGVVETFNAQNQSGIDIDGVLGADIFTSLSPATVPATTNSGSASISASFADLSALQARDYNLRFDGASWTLTDAVSGAPVPLSGTGTVADPFAADGFELVVSGTPTAGDVFRIRPVSAAAGAVNVAVSDPRKIAAAAPLAAAAIIFNVGDGAIAAPQVSDVGNPDLLDSVRIQFDDPPTSYVITDAGGAALTGSLPYTSGADISFNGWTVQISGTPFSNDVFTVQTAGANSGDNRNALALAENYNSGLFDGGRLSVSQISAQLTTAVGSFAARSNAELEVQTAIRTQLELDVEAVSGVNLDEEAANILRYQEAFLASSRAISIANDLFQTIINAIR